MDNDNKLEPKLIMSRSARILKAALDIKLTATQGNDSLTSNNLGLESISSLDIENMDILILESEAQVEDTPIINNEHKEKEDYPNLFASNEHFADACSNSAIENMDILILESEAQVQDTAKINYVEQKDDPNLSPTKGHFSDVGSNLAIENMDNLILQSEAQVEETDNIFVNEINNAQKQKEEDPNFSPSKKHFSESDSDSAISTIDADRGETQDKTDNEETQDKTDKEETQNETRRRRNRAENKALTQKLNKQKGKACLSKTKRQMAEKKLQPNPCNKNCQNGCGRMFDEQSRQNIFNMYWSFDNQAKRSFLLTCMKEVPKARSYVKGNSRRTRTFTYYLPKEGSKVKICLQFLLKTLDLSHRMLSYTFDNKSELQTPKIDKRGKKAPPNKTPEIKTKLVHKFIESLPAVPSHYCRSESTRLYLPIEFKNITNIYRIYKSDFCLKESTTPVSEKVFRTIFLNSYNIGIHAPKKDKCSICESKRDTDDQSESYLFHLREKKLSMSLFKAHQLRSKKNDSFLCVSFELQKVLNTPHGESMLLYYSRKYAMYNFTLYESGTRNGFCYLWGECDAKRGANEICSCLFSYLQDLDARTPAITDVSLFCDSCPGQNKNRQVLVMLHFFVQQSKSIQKISITYLLPGHTYMPADSMHSVIESNYRKKIIWAPSEWPTIITNSRINPKPYVVNVLTHKDFQDWKTFQEDAFNASCQIRSVRQAFIYKNDLKILLHN